MARRFADSIVRSWPWTYWECPTAFADRVVDGLASRLGLLEQQVILASTHTHSGPMTCRLRGLGHGRRGVSRRIGIANLRGSRCSRREQATGASLLGNGARRNRRQSSSDRSCDDKAVLGRNPDGPRDRRFACCTCGETDFPTVLFVHASHPYCLGAEHLLISADFPGHAVAMLAEQGHQAIYLNGCAGDIAPRRAFQGPEAARSEGQRLAEAVLRPARMAAGRGPAASRGVDPFLTPLRCHPSDPGDRNGIGTSRPHRSSGREREPSHSHASADRLERVAR